MNNNSPGWISFKALPFPAKDDDVSTRELFEAWLKDAPEMDMMLPICSILKIHANEIGLVLVSTGDGSGFQSRLPFEYFHAAINGES